MEKNSMYFGDNMGRSIGIFEMSFFLHYEFSEIANLNSATDKISVTFGLAALKTY